MSTKVGFANAVKESGDKWRDSRTLRDTVASLTTVTRMIYWSEYNDDTIMRRCNMDVRVEKRAGRETSPQARVVSWSISFSKNLGV